MGNYKRVRPRIIGAGQYGEPIMAKGYIEICGIRFFDACPKDVRRRRKASRRALSGQTEKPGEERGG